MHAGKFRKPHRCPAQDACSCKTWEDPGLSPWADPQAQCKPDQKLKEGPGTETTFKDWEMGELLVFKEISVKTPAEHEWSEERLQRPHITDFTKNSLGMSLNKHYSKQQKPAEAGGGSDFQSCHIIIFKRSSFQQKLWTMQQNKKVHCPFIEEVNRNCL